ncbi:MAG TPA: CHAD domain-containing protein [Methanocella sp.]
MFYKSMPVALGFKDPEDVHQLRVAGRTVLALLDLLTDEDDMARASFKKTRGSLKKAMSLLGQLRDADVMIDEVGKRLCAMTPAQRNLLDSWLEGQQAARRKLRRKVARKLPQIIGPAWRKRMVRWQRSKESAPANASIYCRKLDELRASREQAFLAIRESLSGPVTLDNTELLDRLHHGRISTKKLRYAMEALAPVMEADEEEIRRLKTFQDQLGHVQDLRTWALKLQSAEGDRRIIALVLKKWQDEMAETLRQTDLAA